MSEQPFDSTQYKAAQRKEWDQVSVGWGKWWGTFERGAHQVSDRLVALAEVQPGHRVLDVATGIGEPAVTAARAVGASGSVTATDQSSGMLEIARSRAKTLGLTNLDFQERDAEQLDFPEQSFDAVVCRWGLMFLPDLGAALGRIHRQLVPGGKFAASVWDTPDKVPLLGLALGVIRKMLQPPPPPPDAPNLFKLAAPGLLEGAMEKAGFAEVQRESLTVMFEFQTAEEYAAWLKDIAAPVNAILANHPEARRAEVWGAIVEAARAFSVPSGGVSIPSQAVCVTGRRGAD